MPQRHFRLSLTVRTLLLWCCIAILGNYASCKYGFRDAAPIPAEIKTFRVQYFENRAQYVNARLSPEITEKTKQKIINTTRLRQTNSDDAHYDISGYISQYYTSTTGISGNVAGTNRLHVGFRLIFVNTLDPNKNFETDLSRTFDFPATQSLDQAENALQDEIVRNIVDEIFNRIFSNW